MDHVNDVGGGKTIPGCGGSVRVRCASERCFLDSFWVRARTDLEQPMRELNQYLTFTSTSLVLVAAKAGSSTSTSYLYLYWSLYQWVHMNMWGVLLCRGKHLV